MHIPTISTKQWVIILATFLLVTIGIAFIATTNPIDGMNAQQDANILAPIDTVTLIPTPVVSTPIPTPTAPYKIIPRNSTYIPSKPSVEPVDANRTYLININPPFDKTDVIIHQGIIFEVSGTTDLPVGSELDVGLSVSTFSLREPPKPGKIDTIDYGSTTGRWYLGGDIYVEPGCTEKQNCASTLNTWRFIVDTQLLRPDEYFLTIQTTTRAHGVAETMITLLEPV
jgi:hypothetical protein